MSINPVQDSKWWCDGCRLHIMNEDEVMILCVILVKLIRYSQFCGFVARICLSCSHNYRNISGKKERSFFFLTSTTVRVYLVHTNHLTKCGQIKKWKERGNMLDYRAIHLLFSPFPSTHVFKFPSLHVVVCTLSWDLSVTTTLSIFPFHYFLTGWLPRDVCCPHSKSTVRRSTRCWIFWIPSHHDSCSLIDLQRFSTVEIWPVSFIDWVLNHRP